MLISVVVPTFQRLDLLERVLESLSPQAQQLDASAYEIIVTDDGRTVTAERLVAEKFPGVRWVQGPRRGPAANRNNGARHARGAWVAFIDDDCLASPQWLREAQAIIQEDRLDVIEGRTIIPDDVDHPLLYGVRNETGGVYWTCNLIIRKATFDAIGGLDEDFEEAAVEDMDLGWRLEKSGARIRFSPGVLVEHPLRRLNWKGVVRSGLVMRWGLLFRLKKGEGLPLEAPTPRVLAQVARGHVMGLVRTTYRALRHPDPTRWKTNLFFQGFHWMSAAWMVPYLCYWEVTYRQQLKEEGGRRYLRYRPMQGPSVTP